MRTSESALTVDTPLEPPSPPRPTRGTLSERLIPTAPATWSTTVERPAFNSETTDERPTRRRLNALRLELVRAAGADGEAARESGVAVRDQLDQLGAAWDVFGTFLSSRYDLFAPAFTGEVDRMRREHPPMPAAEIEAAIVEDHNRPSDTLFADFDPRPIWSSGLAQMNEATLRLTGERVWVRVQRRDAPARIKATAEAMEQLATTFSRVGPLKHIPWVRNLRELKWRMLNHLDYRFTAYQMSQIWRRWRRYRGAHAPRVFRRLCGRHVLVVERIDGVPLSRLLEEQRLNPGNVGAWLEANEIEPKRLARRIYHTFLRDLIEHGLCLSDWDPSRILLLRDSHFSIMPTRQSPIVQLDQDGVRAFRGLVRHLPSRAYSSAQIDLLGMAEPLPQIDPLELRKQMTRELRAWGQRDAVRTLPPADRTLLTLFFAVGDQFRDNRIVFDTNVALALRSLRAVDSIGMVLHPRIRRMALLHDFFVRSVQRIARAATRSESRQAAMTGPAQLDPEAPYEATDTTERYAESVSEQSLQFVNQASKPAYLFEKFFAALRFLTFVGFLFLMVVFVDQEVIRIEQLHDESAGRILTIVPRLTMLDFAFWTIADVWLFTVFHRITLRFRARDSALPKHGAV